MRVLHGLLLIYLTIAQCKKHTVHWDPFLEPRLKAELYIEVEINDFMDILCPREPYNRTSRPYGNAYLELYNVTAEHYKHCSVTGQKRLLHCKDSRQEIKLTTKFQKRSPSPIGFVFQPGKTYYYLSKPMHKKRLGCNSDTLRMAVRVKEESIRTGKFPSLKRHHHSKNIQKENKPKSTISVSKSSQNGAPPNKKNDPRNSALSALKSNNLTAFLSFELLIAFILNNCFAI